MPAIAPLEMPLESLLEELEAVLDVIGLVADGDDPELVEVTAAS